MIVCKVCGAENEQGATFCGTCGSFLEWSGEAVAPDGTPAGGTPAGGTGGQPPPPGPGATGGGVPSGPPPVPPIGGGAGAAGDGGAGLGTETVVTPPPGSLICPNCGQANDPSRVYCSRCATELAPVAAAVPVTPEPTEPRAIPPVAVLGAIVAVVVIGVLAVLFLLPKGSPTPSSEASVAAPSPGAPSASAPGASPSAGASGVIPSGEPSTGPSAEPSGPAALTGLVVFSAERDGNADLWTWDPATDAVERLLRAPGDQGDPAWAPDGSAVVYRDEPGLHMVTADGDPYDPPDFTHHSQDRHPAWSPDGETVVFATDRNPFTSLDIAVRPADDNEADLVRLTDNDADDWDPQWSPDGRQIVFVSKRDGHQRLWLMDADGGREREVKLGPGIYDDPMFSPDGEWLGFTRREQDTKKALYVARVDGSEMRRLTNSNATENDLAWSPDASTIAVVRDDDAGQIVLVEVATGTEIGSFGVDGARNQAPDWWWPPE